MVCPSAETSRGLVLPSLAFGRKVIASHESHSGVGAFFSSFSLYL